MAEKKQKRQKPYKINGSFDEAMKKIVSAPPPKKHKNKE